jgi:drug/metabolite transporter (DMT)-like permease
MMAFFILNENVILSQWFGIVLIILAIVIMNINISFLRKN